MTKRAFDRIVAGLRDAAAIQSGEASSSTYRVHVPETVDEKAIQAITILTQDQLDASAQPAGPAGESRFNWPEFRRPS